MSETTHTTILDAENRASGPIEQVARSQDKLAQSSKNLKSATDAQVPSTYNLTGAQAKYAGQADKATAATDRASTAQRGYFAHITRTTVQSLLVNKAFLLMINAIGEASKQADSIATFPAAVQALGASSVDAQKGLGQLRAYTTRMAASLTDATGTVQRFVQANKNVQASVAMYAGINNALIAGGAGAEAQRGALEQLTQAYTRGSFDAVEFKSALTGMGLAMQETTKELGLANTTQLREAMLSGKISMDQFMTALTKVSTEAGAVSDLVGVRMKTLEYAFAGFQNKVTTSIATVITTLKNAQLGEFVLFLGDVVSTTIEIFSIFLGGLMSLGETIVNFVSPAVQWLGDTFHNFSNSTITGAQAMAIFSSVLVVFRVITMATGNALEALRLKKDAGTISAARYAAATNLLTSTFLRLGAAVFIVVALISFFAKTKIAPTLGSVGGAAGGSVGGVDDLGKSLGKAGKQAKEAQKALAAFDKMNVLPDERQLAAPAGGGGTGVPSVGAPGGFDMPEMNTGGLDELVEKLKDVRWLLVGIGTALTLKGLMDQFKWFDDIIGNTKKALTAFVKVSKDVFTAVKDGVVRAFTAIKGIMSPLVGDLVSIWRGVKDRVVGHLRDLKDGVITVLTNMGIIPLFNKIKDQVVEVFSSIKDRVVNAFNTIKDGIVDAVASIRDYVVDRFVAIKDAVMNTLAPLISGVKGVFSQVKNTIVAVASSIKDVVVSKFYEFKAALVNVVTSIVTTVASIFNQVKDKIVGVFSGIYSAIKPVVQPIINIGKEIGEGIKNSITRSMELLPSGVRESSGKVMGALSEMGAGITAALEPVTNVVGGAMSKMGGFMMNKLNSAIKWGIAGLGGLITGGFTLALEQGPEALTAKVDEFMQKIFSGPEIITGMMESISSIFNTIATNVEPIVNAMIQIVNTIVNTILSEGPRIAKEFFGAIMKMIDQLTKADVIGKMVSGVVELLVNIVKGIANALPVIINGMVNAITRLIDIITEPNMLDMLIDNTINALLSIIEGIIKVLPKLIDGFVKMMVKLIEVLTRPDVLNRLINAAIDLVVTLVTALLDNIDKLIVAAVKLIVGIAKGLWDNREKIWNAMLDIAKKIGSKLLSIDFLQIGKDIIKGLWNGINNMGKWIGDKIRNFGATVMKGLKSFFGIKSPSRLVRDQIGKNIGEGLAEGITDSAGEAVSAAQEAAEGVYDVFSGMETSIGKLDTEFGVTGSLMPYSGGAIPSVSATEYMPQTNVAASSSPAIEGAIIGDTAGMPVTNIQDKPTNQINIDVSGVLATNDREKRKLADMIAKQLESSLRAKGIRGTI